MIDKDRRRVLVVTINDKFGRLDLRSLGSLREEIKKQLCEGVVLLPPWCDAMVVDIDNFNVRIGDEQDG